MRSALFSAFDHLVVLDTETSGIAHKTDEIIELAALRAVPGAARSILHGFYTHGKQFILF